MVTTTPNFGWSVPTSTDLVKDGATAIELLGDSIDASLVDLKGGTTGQVLSKASNTDMDFTWVTDAAGDITGVTAGTGISGGGTSGTVTVTNSMATAIDAKGDLIGGTGADTFSRLAVGANGTVLTADSAEATGLKWAAASTGALTLVKSQTIGTTVSSVTVTDAFSATYDNYIITIAGGAASTTQDLNLTFGATSTGYYWAAGRFFPGGGSAAMASASNTSSFRATTYNAGNVTTKIEIQQPYLSKPTAYQSSSQTTGEINLYQGLLDNTTSYTAFTLTTGGGTLTGGTIRVYGYQNS